MVGIIIIIAMFILYLTGTKLFDIEFYIFINFFFRFN